MKRLLSILLLLALLCSVAGCQSSAPGTSAPESSGSTGEPASPAGDSSGSEAPEASGGPKQGGVVTIAIKSDANTLLTTEMRAVNEHNYASIIYEGLFTVNEEGKPEPLLCESYEEDLQNLTYTLHLRQGVKFHDGTDFNAEVCAWNLELYKAEGIQASAFLKHLDRVEVVDDYTVVLHLSAWDSLIPFSLMRQAGWMMSKAHYEANGADYVRENPVGTGAFKFVKWDRGVGMSFERFDDYWRGAPYLDGVEMEIYSTDLVAQAAMEAGDVHVIWPTEYEIADYLAGKGYISTNSVVPEFNYSLCFKCTDPNSPTYDLKVRQAIAYAIDRDEVFTGVFQGHGVAVTQYGAPGGAFYDDAFDGYAYDPEKAKALLAEAGYENGLSLTVACQSLSTRVNTCTIVKEQLAKVGITLELNVMDTADFSNAIDGWTDDMLLHTNLMGNGAASQINAAFRQNLTAGLGITSLLHPDELEAAIVEAVSADGAVSNDLWKGVQRKIFGDYTMLKALVTNYTVTVVSPNLHDAEMSVVGAATNTLYKAWLD